MRTLIITQHIIIIIINNNIITTRNIHNIQRNKHIKIRNEIHIHIITKTHKKTTIRQTIRIIRRTRTTRQNGRRQTYDEEQHTENEEDKQEDK